MHPPSYLALHFISKDSRKCGGHLTRRFMGNTLEYRCDHGLLGFHSSHIIWHHIALAYRSHIKIHSDQAYYVFCTPFWIQDRWSPEVSKMWTRSGDLGSYSLWGLHEIHHICSDGILRVCFRVFLHMLYPDETMFRRLCGNNSLNGSSSNQSWKSMQNYFNMTTPSNLLKKLFIPSLITFQSLWEFNANLLTSTKS